MTNRTAFSALRTLYAKLSKKRKRELVPVLVLLLAGALAEVLTIGALMPFLAVIAQPDGSPVLRYLAPMLNAAGAETVEEKIYVLAAAFALAAIIAAALRLVLLWAIRSFVYGIGYDLSTMVYANVLHQPYVFHTRQNSSEILAAISKVQFWTDNALIYFLYGIVALVISLFIVASLVMINPLVAVSTGAGFIVVYLIVSFFFGPRLSHNSSLLASAQNDRVKAMQEGLGGIRDLLIDRSQPAFIESYASAEAKSMHACVWVGFMAGAPRFVVEAAGMIIIATVTIFLIHEADGISGAIPVLGALALGAQRLLPLIQQAYNGWAQMVGNGQLLQDIAALLERPMPVVTDPPDPLPFSDSIRLDDVHYSYTKDRVPALDGVTFEISKGARIGIAGRTGSGKSTLMDIILGLLEPNKGEVRVDGVLLDSRTRLAWQRVVAHVPQFIFLADVSIAENIAFGVRREDIDFERVRRVAKQAELSAVLAELPDGLETRIGERGVQLSGGQRQRVGIARALYKQASVLVFDEATSALDAETEDAVMTAIERLERDLTIVIIAHRLSTLENCDLIIRLEGGRIAEVGANRREAVSTLAVSGDAFSESSSL